MSGYYPHPSDNDGRRSTASRYGPGQPPPASNSYRPPPPSFAAPPPPSSSSNSFSWNDQYSRDRDRDRDRDRGGFDRGYGRGYDRSYDRDRARDHERDRRDNRDSYRDNFHSLPPRPQTNSYRDSRDSRDTRASDSFRPPQGDFTFSAPKPPGVGDSYRPVNFPPDAGSAASRGPKSYSDRRSGRGNSNNSNRGRFGRGGRVWHPFKPAERAILMGGGNSKPSEDFADEDNGITYRAIDQLSDSDEADMDISDSDAESGEPTAKRPRTTAQAANGDSAPKWCNPDPYDALPPIEDKDRKKKDMVHMIRKARVQPATATRTSLPAPANDEDFIRCDSDSDEQGGDASDDVFIDPLTYNRGEPSTLSHKLPPKPASIVYPGSGQVAAPVTQTQASANGRIAVQDVTNNSNLGSRKRTHDDVLKLPSHAQLQPANRKPAGGRMVREWRAKPGRDSHPWVRVPNSKCHVNVRLHMEVKDFYDHVKPCQFEDRLRSKLVEDLNHRVGGGAKREYDRDRQMYPFGSYMSGLYLPTADMDLAYCSRNFVNGGREKFISKSAIRRFIDALRSDNVAVNNKIEAVTGAKVPIGKYVDRVTGLKVDISFENKSGLIAIDTFKTWKEQWPAMPILVTVVKQFLLMRGLNEPVNGGIGGFTVICMVVSMLQLMPAIQSGDMVSEHNLGSLVMHFFDLYGNRFNHKTTALRLNPPGYVNKNHVREFVYRNPDRLSVIDPNNPANDISGGSLNYPQIRACFAEAYKSLQDKLLRVAAGEKFDSILEVILGGDYTTFREQRDYLRKLHIKTFGDCDE